MTNQLSKNILDILQCPQCGLIFGEGSNLTCNSCKTDYSYTLKGALDLRLKKPKKYPLTFELGEDLPNQSNLDINPLEMNATPEVDYSGVDMPHHMSQVTLSHLPAAQGPKSLALDLGCGPKRHKEICQHAGFEYVGVDLDASQSATILGNAQSLPFKDNSFELIVSIAVLEHIRFPFVAMQEVYRVLKPNGRFLGTVAFSWPFHGDSFYHCTHLGTINLLEFAGFNINDISASKRSVIMGHARGLFPRMPPAIAYTLAYPLLALHKTWYQLGSLLTTGNLHNKETVRLQNHTSGFSFIASKESSHIGS